MQDPKQSKFARAKQFVKDYEGPIAFGVGITVGTVIVAKYPKFYLKPFALYDPAQPIPGLHLTEEAIKWEIIAGFLASDFLKGKDLMDEFGAFAGEKMKTSMDLRPKA